MVLPALFTAGQGAMGVFDDFFGKDKLKKQLAEQKRVGLRYGQEQLGQAKQGLQATLAGFDKADRAASASSRAAKRRTQEALDKVVSSFLSRAGIGSGTAAAAQAAEGAAGMSVNAAQDTDAAFAGLLGRLATGRGAAESQGRQNISQAIGQMGQVELGNLQSLYNLHAQTTPWQILNQTASAVGNVAGAFM